MYKEEVTCSACEAEFYIESNSEVYFCVHCGNELDENNDDLVWDDEDAEE